MHEGGTRDPSILSWSGHIPDDGNIRRQFHHIVDDTPTILELLSVDVPEKLGGYHQQPIDGRIMFCSFPDAPVPTTKPIQYLELFVHRAIWTDVCKAVTTHCSKSAVRRLRHIDHGLQAGEWDGNEWELFCLDDDPSETRDLPARYHARLDELTNLWRLEARRHQVLPLGSTLLECLQAKRALASSGGLDGGYVRCIFDGRVHYVSNFLGRAHAVLAATDPLETGEHDATFEFTRTGQHAGVAVLILDGARVDEATIPRTTPIVYAAVEGLEIGSDTTSPIWPAYKPPFRLSGHIMSVTISTASDRPPLSDLGAVAQDVADMLRQ